MKAPAMMKIVVHTEPVSVIGNYEVVSMDLPPREVYLNDEKCPPGLERIILAGLDSMTEAYLDGVEIEMRHKLVR